MYQFTLKDRLSRNVYIIRWNVSRILAEMAETVMSSRQNLLLYRSQNLIRTFWLMKKLLWYGIPLYRETCVRRFFLSIARLVCCGHETENLLFQNLYIKVMVLLFEYIELLHIKTPIFVERAIENWRLPRWSKYYQILRKIVFIKYFELFDSILIAFR